MKIRDVASTEATSTSTSTNNKIKYLKLTAVKYKTAVLRVMVSVPRTAVNYRVLFLSRFLGRTDYVSNVHHRRHISHD